MLHHHGTTDTRQNVAAQPTLRLEFYGHRDSAGWSMYTIMSTPQYKVIDVSFYVQVTRLELENIVLLQV